jgi:hypothetical protein
MENKYRKIIKKYPNGAAKVGGGDTPTHPLHFRLEQDFVQEKIREIVTVSNSVADP